MIDYFKIRRISNSDLEIAKNILLERTPPPRPTQAFSFGSAFHEALLEPEKYDPKNWEAKGCDMNLLEKMLETASQNDVVQKIMKKAKLEEIVSWEHQETGVLCKSKLDIIQGTKYKLVSDIKTTSARTQAAFEQDFEKYNYNRQAAFYMQSVSAVEFFCIGVSKTTSNIFIVRKFLTDKVILSAKQDIKTLLWQIKKHDLYEKVYANRG